MREIEIIVFRAPHEYHNILEKSFAVQLTADNGIFVKMKINFACFFFP